MNLAGFDCATTTGIALWDGAKITASSFRPKEKRPKDAEPGRIDYNYEGRVLREMSDYIRVFLHVNKIEAAAIETPLPPDFEVTETEVDETAEWAGQALIETKKKITTMQTIYRLYNFHGEICRLCAELNIPIHAVNQRVWRKAFLGRSSAPDHIPRKDRGKYLKKLARAQCAQLRIECRNDDQGDAVGVLWWLQGTMNLHRTGELFGAA